MGRTEGVEHGNCTKYDVHMSEDRAAGLSQSGRSYIFPLEQVKWLIEEYHLWIGDSLRSPE
jgi:hypothetical protein